MEEVAAESACRGSVELVAGHGVTDAGQMHANLVRAAGPDANLEERGLVEALKHGVFRDSRAAGSQFRRHANSANGVANDGRGDPAPLRFDAAVNERQINLFDLAA